MEKLPSDIKKRTIEIVKEILVRPYSGVMLVGPLKGFES